MLGRIEDPAVVLRPQLHSELQLICNPSIYLHKSNY